MKKTVVNEFVRIIRKYELSYDQAISYSKEARSICELSAPKKRKSTKQQPTTEEIRKFFKTVEKKSITDRLIMKILLYMGLRTKELVNIKIKDLELEPGSEKLYARRKRGENKYFVIPHQLVESLKIYIETIAKKNVYLFESKFHKKYNERSIRLKFQKYREEAEISKNVHPHAFRSAIITFLSSEGWSTRQIQLVSGHSSSSSVDIYDKNNPEGIRNKLNQSINSFEKKLLGK